MGKMRGWRCWAGCLAALLVWVVGSALLDVCALLGGQLAFDRQAWAQDGGMGSSGTRWRMRDSAREAVHPGMTIEEAKERLGPPEPRAFYYLAPFDSEEWPYKLWHVDSSLDDDHEEALVVQFRDGRVVGIRRSSTVR